MDIPGVSGVETSFVSPLAQNTHNAVVPGNVKNIDPSVNSKAAVVSNATNSPVSPTIPNINGTVVPNIAVTSGVTNNPVVETLQNANVTFIPDTTEVAVPTPPPFIPFGSPTSAPVNANDIQTETPVQVTLPAQNTTAVPDTTLATVPDTSPADNPDIIPPITAFSTAAGETMEINPAPEEDTSGIGNHGAVEAVMPPQPAFNNAAAESTEAKFKNNTIPAKVPSTGKRPRDYLRTINKRAQATDLAFKRQHLPYQFEVLADGQENIYIDLSILDEKGKVIKHEKRDVTNESFGRLMDNISSGKGLLIDDLPRG